MFGDGYTFDRLHGVDFHSLPNSWQNHAKEKLCNA